MRKVGNMKLYSIDEILDEDLGKIGTPERDKFETELQAEVHAYHIGEAIRNARKEKKLTPEDIAATIAAYESTQDKGLVEEAANKV